jgi:signal transduction histidine kinase
MRYFLSVAHDGSEGVSPDGWLPDRISVGVCSRQLRVVPSLGGGTVARQGNFDWPVARAVPPQFPLSRDLALAPGKAGPSGSDGAPRQSQRLHGRLAAVFFAGSGVLVLLTLPVPVRGLNVAVMAAVAVVSLAVGLVAWAVPWDRWPRRASLVLIPPAFALIALANMYGLHWHASAGARVYTTVLIISLCVLVAEGIGWTAAKLKRMELALQREKDRTERLRELDEMKDNSLSSVSHELRNPITICRGHLEVLQDGASRQEVRAVKETLINELDLMARLVGDLTTRARVDDQAQLRIERLPLDQFVTSIEKKAAPILGHRLKIEYDVPDATLRADPQRLSQALLNLLRNAAEHARGEGPVRFRVMAETESWRFEVADEGGGLVPGHEQVVFEPFRTGSPVTGGTGLGLSIVRGIARAHGGDCGVANRPGRGATFWIRTPR